MDKKSSSNSNEYISMLYEIRKYAGEHYDKLIIYLSSGALVLTVGFVKDIVEKIIEKLELRLLIVMRKIKYQPYNLF